MDVNPGEIFRSDKEYQPGCRLIVTGGRATYSTPLQ